MKSFIALLLSIPQVLMCGLVFSHMWNWFIVRKFESAPRLNTLDAVGILMVLSFPLISMALINARKEIKNNLKEKNIEVTEGGLSIALTLITTLFIYPVILGFAALWHNVIGN